MTDHFHSYTCPRCALAFTRAASTHLCGDRVRSLVGGDGLFPPEWRDDAPPPRSVVRLPVGGLLDRDAVETFDHDALQALRNLEGVAGTHSLVVTWGGDRFALCDAGLLMIRLGTLLMEEGRRARGDVANG